jgi:hypothetical protein
MGNNPTKCAPEGIAVDERDPPEKDLLEKVPSVKVPETPTLAAPRERSRSYGSESLAAGCEFSSRSLSTGTSYASSRVFADHPHGKTLPTMQYIHMSSSTRQITSDHWIPFGEFKDTLAEKEYSSRPGVADTSTICLVCSKALEALSVLDQTAVTIHDRTFIELDESARSGCHLCYLISHFLPERPQNLSDWSSRKSELTLQLRWNGMLTPLLWVGWDNQELPFKLLQFGELTPFRE